MPDETIGPKARRSGFDHRVIDSQWQARWATERAYETPSQPRPGKKQYLLDMFPYPSGAGLHVGHPRGFVATDVLARLRRAQGFDVLHPMGWDAFGLPAENYAIKSGIHPAVTTQASIKRFRQQIDAIGLSYDWSRELNTSDPAYYRWTQWIFLRLFERGLAYQKEAPVNWCPKDQTVLANEQVVNGLCDRCESAVEQKDLTQWFFKTTAYADELLSNLEDLNWPEPIKTMQRNWIGKSEGVIVQFPVANQSTIGIDIFTTRVDTIFSAAFVVLAPEHPMVASLTVDSQQSIMQAYRSASTAKTNLDRLSAREQTGVFTGSYATNPATSQRLPIWVADFVIGGYGTGAIFGDIHDERDVSFARRYQIPLTVSVLPFDPSLQPDVMSQQMIYTGEGTLINSGQFNGQTSQEARRTIGDWLVRRGQAKSTIQYKLRDWLVSRQRYWGAPIPIIHCPNCGAVAVPDDQLPVILPTDVDFLPNGTSPLTRSESFQKTRCPRCNVSAERDTDTMDTFVDSSWYFLRFLNPQTDVQAIDQELVKSWLPVDVYVGGAEHAILHLLYARFMTKALADIIGFDLREPFQRLVNVGLVRSDDGRKMSKSLGNVVNPDHVIAQYGADTLRAYELFMGPFSDSMPWSTRSMIGVRRWLDRIWGLKDRMVPNVASPSRVEQQLNTTIAKITDDLASFKFNTAVSSLMELTNALTKLDAVSSATLQTFLILLAPIAPHLASEIWLLLKLPGQLSEQPWPVADESQLKSDTVTIALQIDGKTRSTLTIATNTVEATLITAARHDPAIQRHLSTEPNRTVVVPNRIVNFIT